MQDDAGFWVFQVPNMLLAIAIYTLLGRYILSLMFQPDSNKVIWQVFRQLTDPILKVVAFVTPRVVPMPLISLLAIVWLLLLRVILFLTIRALGLLPTISG